VKQFQPIRSPLVFGFPTILFLLISCRGHAPWGWAPHQLSVGSAAVSVAVEAFWPQADSSAAATINGYFITVVLG